MKSNGLTVGISISEPDKDDLGKLGLGLVHLQDAMVETARFLLSKGYNLAYGGDLNYDGPFNFTDLLFQLGMTYGGLENRISNYSAFPMYTKITQKRKAELINVAKIVSVNPSQDFDRWLNVSYESAPLADKQYLDELFEGKTEQAKQIWAESLTEMRRQMTQNIQCRIVMGGKTQNYKGSMPGIIEETLMCFKNKIPVLVDGRFGGAAKQIVDAIVNKRPHNETVVPAEFSRIRESDFKKITGDIILLKGNDSVGELENLIAIL
jgi:hypothetical protein